MKRKREERYQLPCMEQLEPRLMMSGNVVVEAAGGGLRITGDGLNNGIRIFQDDFGNHLVVGLDHGGGRTTVNGVALGIFSGITGSVRIDMRNGNDMVNFGRAGIVDTVTRFYDGVQVEMGGGTNIVSFGTDAVRRLGRVNIDGNLTLGSRGGVCSTLIAGANIDGGLNARFDRDSASAVIFRRWNLAAPPSDFNNGSVNGSVRFSGGSLILSDIVANGSINFSGGDHNNVIAMTHAVVVGNVKINTGDGEDTLMVSDESSIIGALNVNTGNENDTLTLSDTLINSSIKVNTGQGVDELELSEATILGNVKMANQGTFDFRVTAPAGFGTFVRGNFACTSRGTWGIADLNTLIIAGQTKITGLHRVWTTNCRWAGRTSLTSPQSGTFGLDMVETDFENGLSVRGGVGRNIIYLESTEITGNLSIRTGNAIDFFELNDATIDGAVSITTGGGEDIVTFDTVMSSGTTTVNTGSEADGLEFSRVVITTGFNVIAGDGNDEIFFELCGIMDSDVTIDGGNGERDTLLLEANRYGFPSYVTRGIERVRVL